MVVPSGGWGSPSFGSWGRDRILPVLAIPGARVERGYVLRLGVRVGEGLWVLIAYDLSVTGG